MVARNQLSRPAYRLPAERRRRALCLATLVVAAVAVGMSGSAVWAVVASMGDSG